MPTGGRPTCSRASSVAESRPRRIAILLGLLAVGVVIGTLGAFVQADRWLIGSVPIPWGAIVVVAVLVGVERGATWAVMSRWGAWLVFGGWLVASLFFAADGPNGDLAISGGGRQMGYLIAAVILGSATATIRVPSSAPRSTTGV